jgi:hypothetical protein
MARAFAAGFRPLTNAEAVRALQSAPASPAALYDFLANHLKKFVEELPL